VYAAMLACGTNVRDASGGYPPREGAGSIELPGAGRIWWGSVQLSAGDEVRIPVSIGPLTARRVRGAIWWDDGSVRIDGGLVFYRHADYLLELLDKAGHSFASSSGTRDCFERIDVGGIRPPLAGRRPPVGVHPPQPVTLHIENTNLARGWHTVYWALIATP